MLLEHLGRLDLHHLPQNPHLYLLARITGQERRGFIEALPYNSDEDFYKFAFRAANKEAENLGLDGVIYPDAAYLATQPQRTPNDAFLRNYGRVISRV